MGHLIGRLCGFAILFSIVVLMVLGIMKPEFSSMVFSFWVGILIILGILAMVGIGSMLLISGSLSPIKSFVGWLKS